MTHDTELPAQPPQVDPAAVESAQVSPAAGPSAGALLREARTVSGMHIATLSMALKVPVKKLEALEAEDWSILPDPVFVRALATSVCRHIKTDSAPILAALPQKPYPRTLDDTITKGLNQRFRASTDPKPSLFRLPVSIPMMLGALVCLLAAVVLIFLPDMTKRLEPKKLEVTEVIAPANMTPPSETASVSMVPVDTISNPVAPVLNASTPAGVAAPSSLPAALPSVLPTALPVTLPPKSVPATPSSAPAAALPSSGTPSILRMTAKGIVWIEVKDAKGTLLAQRTMQPQEVINVSGTPPLAVVVGRINEMQSIEVRGKPFSLTGLSPDNVARFEVK